MVIIIVLHWPPLVLLSLLPLVILRVTLIHIPAPVRIHIIWLIGSCLATGLRVVRPVCKTGSCVIIVRITATSSRVIIRAIEIIRPGKIICSIISCHYITPETVHIVRVIAGIDILVPVIITPVKTIRTRSVPSKRWAIH